VIVAGSLTLFERNLFDAPRRSESAFPGSSVFFSPTEDLEESDVNLLNSAKSTIDVAMYAFTDEPIQSSLVAAAKRGVKIRIYRDALQLADEEARALQRHGTSAADILKAVPGIEIRIKTQGKSMHLKSYCVDRALLRTGSANWSPQGELAQDNDIYLISDPEIIRKFESDFDLMWNRASNTSP